MNKLLKGVSIIPEKKKNKKSFRHDVQSEEISFSGMFQKSLGLLVLQLSKMFGTVFDLLCKIAQFKIIPIKTELAKM